MNSIDTSKDIAISPVMQEEFRSLQTNIEFSGADCKVICITSSYPNEGKSFVSYQLAKALAETNPKVLLIDADMRNSTLHQKLGFEKEIPGLSHLLARKNVLNDVIYATSSKNLYLLPTGVFSSNPTTLLRTEVFRRLLDTLKNNFDYIIIDTPPVGLVTDSVIIAKTSDAAILVIGSAMENRRRAKESIEALKAVNENFLGVIINKMENKSAGSYGRYGKYGNGYVYGERKDSRNGK